MGDGRKDGERRRDEGREVEVGWGGEGVEGGGGGGRGREKERERVREREREKERVFPKTNAPAIYQYHLIL